MAQPDDGSAWLRLVNAVPRTHSLLAQVMPAADHGGVVVLDRAHRRGRERIAGAAMEGSGLDVRGSRTWSWGGLTSTARPGHLLSHS